MSDGTLNMDTAPAIAILYLLLNKYAEIDLEHVDGKISAQDVLDNFAPYVASIGSAVVRIMDSNPEYMFSVLFSADDMSQKVEQAAQMLGSNY